MVLHERPLLVLLRDGPAVPVVRLVGARACPVPAPCALQAALDLHWVAFSRVCPSTGGIFKIVKTILG
eukprot:6880869-Pyramimonas_sp.AAC.1